MLQNYFSGDKNFEKSIFNLKSKIVVFFIFMAVLGANAQTAATYNFSQSAGTYSAITGGTLFDNAVDNGVYGGTANLLPFTFAYAGSNYTSLRISSNGFVTLGGGTTPSTSVYFPVSNTGTAYNTSLSPFAQDLNSTIRYEVLGATPNRVAVVQWSSAYRYSAGTEDLNFQIRLYESTNVIEFIYGTMNSTNTSLTTKPVEIGIKSASSVYNNVTMTNATLTGYSYTNSWNSLVNGALQTDVVPLTTAIKPASGTVLRWTPSNCVQVVVSATATSLTNNSATLSWTNTATYSSGYRIRWRKVEDSYSTATWATPVSVAAGSSSYIINGLQTATYYVYSVEGLCSASSANNFSTVTTANTTNGKGLFQTLLSSCATPSAQPTALNLTSITSTTLSGAFSAASPAPSKYLVVRSTSATAPTPANGTVYAVGSSTLGTGTYVVSNTSSLTFSETSLASNTNYYYYIFSYNDSCGGAPYYNTTLPLQANAITCLAAPTSAAATSLTNSSFTANWSAVAGATGYLLDVSTNNLFSSFVSGYNGLVISGGSTVSQSVTALNAATTYYYRVRATNATSCASADSGTITLVTACNNSTLTLNEGFNTSGTAVFPSCWSSAIVAVQTGTKLSFETSGANPTTSPQEGTRMVRYYSFNSGAGGAGSEERLISPPITTTGTANIDVEFYWRNENNTTYNSSAYLNEGVQVQYSLDKITWVNAGSFLSRHDATIASGNAQWKLKTVALPAGAGNKSTVYVAFKFHSEFGDNMYLDGVSIKPGASCVAPTAPSGVASSSTSANLSWTASTSVPSGGYEWEVRFSGIGGSGATGLQANGATLAGVVTATASSLLANTNYTLYVRSNCGASDFSTWVASAVFKTPQTPPVNDACANATSLPCGTSGMAGTTVGSVSETLSVSGWSASNYGVWYTFVGDGTNNLISSTPASGFDHRISIASGSCGALTNIASIDLSTGTETYSLSTVLGTVYYVYISYYSVAGASSDTGTFTISRTCSYYCVPSSSAGSVANNYISNVSFLGTLNDVSNASTYSSSPAGYSNFTGLANRSSQIQGEPINVSVQINVNSNLKAWIDWNKNGVFTDAGEMVFDSNLANAVLSSSTFGFVVPNVAPGDYKIRIRAGANSFDSCSVSNSSDTEDYVFTVIERCAAEIFTVTSGERCGPGIVNLEATGTAGVQFRWYTAATGGSLLATTASGNYAPSVTATTSFFVTAFNGTCETQIRKEVIARVKELAAITLPTLVEACGDKTPIVLTATANTETVYLLNENFENGLGSMSSVENGTANAIAKWRLKTGPFKPNEAAGTWLPVISSGFGSNSFAMATSDMGADYSLDNALQPTNAYNTTGFVNLTLKFRMYFSRFYVDNVVETGKDEFVNIEVSTNGGTTWIATPIFKYVTDIGNPGNMANISLNLNAYVNQSNLKFRIRYKTQKWTHGLAVDDIQLYGEKTLVPSFTWSTSAGAGLNVYTDAAMTVPYVSGAPASTVYVLPDITALGNTTFDINVSTTVTNGCVITKTINVTNKSKVWNGSASADWGNANNWSPIGIPDANACIIIPNTAVKPIVSGTANGKNISIMALGELVVNSGHTLTINDAIEVKSTGKFTFENNASLVQVNENPNINSGAIFYKRNSSNMLRYSYTYWSSPVYANEQTLKALSPATLSTKYFSWDIMAQNWLTHTNGEVTMEKAKGYIVRAPQSFPVSGTPSSLPVVFKGVPNNGLITIQTEGSTSQEKWNLIGNPYPSALIADLFLANSINPDIEGTLYLWTNHTGRSSVPDANGYYLYTNNDYAVYNFSGGTATAPAVGSAIEPTGFVAAGQSFFVKGISNGAGMATFNNTMRKVANNDQFFRNSNEELPKHRFWLNLENSQGGFNQALIAYIEGATNNYDRGFDGEVFGGNSATLYSIIPEKNLTIQGRRLPFEVTDSVKLGYKTTVAGNYKITLDHLEGLFSSQAIYLKDNLLNIVHPIKDAPYNFTSLIGTFNDRFEIVYELETLGIETPIFKPESVIVYKKDKSVHVNTGQVMISQLKVFDIHGRMLYEANNLNTSEAIINGIPPVNQVLLIQVMTESGNKISKKLLY